MRDMKFVFIASRQEIEGISVGAEDTEQRFAGVDIRRLGLAEVYKVLLGELPSHAYPGNYEVISEIGGRMEETVNLMPRELAEALCRLTDAQLPRIASVYRQKHPRGPDNVETVLADLASLARDAFAQGKMLLVLEGF